MPLFFLAKLTSKCAYLCMELFLLLFTDVQCVLRCTVCVIRCLTLSLCMNVGHFFNMATIQENVTPLHSTALAMNAVRM